MSQLFKNMLTSLNGTQIKTKSIEEHTVGNLNQDINRSSKLQISNNKQQQLASNNLKQCNTKNAKSGHRKSLMGKVIGRFHYSNFQQTNQTIGKNSNMNRNAKDCQSLQNTKDQCDQLDVYTDDLKRMNMEKNEDNSEINDHDHDDNDDEDEDDKENVALPEELCDLPSFKETKNCDLALIEETRRLLRERFAKQNPNDFYQHDYERMLTDDWTVTRFLLRRRMDPKRTAKLMEECGLFRKTYKMSEVKLWEFPIEFHQVGGLFRYEPDKVGNITVYMRTRMYRRVPELSDVFKAFVLCVLEEADCANDGRGVAVIFDLTGCGLQNVDLSFLSWLLSSFRNYCPKGVSYIMVYNLPWFLNATAKLAMSWLSSSNRRALRFVHGKEIENFIEPENLPDYLGGTCKKDYKAIPDGSKLAVEVCDRLDMSKEQALKIRDMFTQYLPDENDDQEQQLIDKSQHAEQNQVMSQEKL